MKTVILDSNLDNIYKNITEVTLDRILKNKKEKIEKLFTDYRPFLSRVSIRSEKKVEKILLVPIKLNIDFLNDKLTVEVYCDRHIDSLLLEMSNIGVVSIREEHKKLINERYKTNFPKELQLYVEPTSRLDIFYKKALDLTLND